MMNKAKNQIVAILFLCLLPFSGPLFAGGLFGGDDAEVLWRSGPNQYIKYAGQDRSKYGNNDHPVQLDPRNIAVALESVKIQSGGYFAGDEDTEPLFSVPQARRLGEQLAKGLERARPDQDIVFVLEKSVRKLLFFTGHVFVAGRAFYQDGKLNVIIGEYDKFRNEAFEKVYDTSGKMGAPYSFNHGSRSTSSGKLKQNVVTNAGVENKNLGNDLRQDWLVIDVDKAVAAVAADKRRKGQQEDTDDTAATRQMRLETARMQKEQRELRAEMARMRKEMRERDGGGGGDASLGERSVEDRLEALEKLYKQDLISKEEYQAKRQEILGDI